MPLYLVYEGLLLADLGRSSQHSMLPKRKVHELSRQAAPDPKRTQRPILLATRLVFQRHQML